MKLILLVLACVALARAATKLGGDNVCQDDTCYFKLDVAYADGSPDGTDRKIITINGQFPGPTLEVLEGVDVEVEVTNNIGTEGLTVHWHGIHQYGTPWNDGVPVISQCVTDPGQKYTYKFKATPAGSHWYHSHNGMQRLDGLWGMIIVRRADEIEVPASNNDYVLQVGDWDHTSSEDKVEHGEGPPSGPPPPFPMFWGLINGLGRQPGHDDMPLDVFECASGGQTRLRMMNAANVFGYRMKVHGHQMTVVSTDGNDIINLVVDSLILFPGERYDVIIDCDQAEQNYWIEAHPLYGPPGMAVTPYAVLSYTGDASDPTTTARDCTADDQCIMLNCDDSEWYQSQNYKCMNADEMQAPADQASNLGEPDVTYFWNLGMSGGPNINNWRFANPSTYLPEMKDVNNGGCDPDSSFCTQFLDLPKDAIVEIVVSDLDTGDTPDHWGHHPMHIHGHTYEVKKVAYAPYDMDTNTYTYHPDVECTKHECHWTDGRPELMSDNPVQKDTVNVPSFGYIVIRFKADNPGYWLFHCHVEPHAEAGMIVMFREAADDIPAIPDDVPTCGNFFGRPEPAQCNDGDAMCEMIWGKGKGNGK